MAYRKTSAGYELESVPFSAGRIYATSNINGTTYDVNYHLTDQVGSVRAVVNSGGEVQQQSDYYAFGLRHASTDFATNDNRYQLTGKESQKDFGFNYLDFHARQYDPTGIQFTSQDPLQDEYTSIGSYNYCANNPIRFVDPDGRKIDDSQLSEEQRKQYSAKIAEQKDSKLFNAVYSILENSKEVYTIAFGQTELDSEGKPVGGQFEANKSGGGNIIFLKGNAIDSSTLQEELFHAFQHDNKKGYAQGEFNFEFEAKVSVTAMSANGGSGWTGIAGAEEYGNQIGYGELGMTTHGAINLSPDVVKSDNFITNYKKAANAYQSFNINNKIGNVHYQRGTAVAPYSLQQMINKAYGK